MKYNEIYNHTYWISMGILESKRQTRGIDREKHTVNEQDCLVQFPARNDFLICVFHRNCVSPINMSQLAWPVGFALGDGSKPIVLPCFGGININKTT